MTDHQEDTQSMIRTVLSIWLLYASDIAAIPDLDSDFQDLKTQSDAIKALIPKQKVHTTGVTREKEEVQTELIIDTLLISGAVRGFASKNGMTTLYEEVNYSKTELEALRDTELSDICKLVHDRANTHVAALAGRGITPTVLSDFMTLITDYEAMDQAPRTATVQKSTATAGIPVHLSAARKIMTERLDGGIRIFIHSKPEIVTAIQKARKIVDTGHRKRKNIPTGTVSFHVKDAANNPLENVLVSGGQLIGSTDSDGNGKIKGLDPGTVSMHFFLTNYGEIFQDVTIINGQETAVTVVLPVTLGQITGNVAFITGSGPATVNVQGTPITTSTDASGNFTLNNVPAGTETLIASPASNPANMLNQNTVVIANGSVVVNFVFP
jgi:hypothetical protein